MATGPSEVLSWDAVFEDRYTPEPNTGCYLWTKSLRTGGYGQLTLQGRVRKAHRVSMELSLGSPLGKKCVLHKCDQPACINPRHLFLGTHADNNKDTCRKNRQARGSRYGRSSLTDKDIPDIRALLKQGVSQGKTAARYGVSRSAIEDIAHGRTWKHVQ